MTSRQLLDVATVLMTVGLGNFFLIAIAGLDRDMPERQWLAIGIVLSFFISAGVLILGLAMFGMWAVSV